MARLQPARTRQAKRAAYLFLIGLVLLVPCRPVPGATPVSGAGHFDPVVQRQRFEAGAAISAELCEPRPTYRVLNGTSAFSIAPAAIAVSAPRQRSPRAAG